MKKFPDHISCITHTENSLLIEFLVNHDLFWFEGHFPAHRLLPGVTQIDWVMHFIRTYFNRTTLTAAARVKFQNPIVPDEKIQLEIVFKEADNVHFTYKGMASDIKSQGTLKVT